MDITIPDKFNSKLEQTLWAGSVNNFLIKIVRIFNAGDEFFPNYTDHGVKHIQKVLDYSARLISAETLEMLDDSSLGVLIMGILYHDLGMFIHCYGQQSPQM